MPLPIIIPIVATVAGVVGIGKGVKAVKDNNDANKIDSTAKEIVDTHKSSLEQSRKNCETVLENLGRSKVDALTLNLQKFVTTYEQLKNVSFSEAYTLDNLKVSEFSHNTLKDIKQNISLLTASGLALGGGAATGAMIAFGAYNGTMVLATASTGTAISALSGAAATNATLAWLGGGTLASGGFGMAGGTLALGAITAGPALLVAGWYMGAKAETALNNAKSNKEQAEKFREDAKSAILLTNGITEVAQKAIEILSVLKKHSRRSTKAMVDVISQQGTDFSKYDDKAKDTIFRAVKIVQALKAVIDTPILNEDGALLDDVDAKIINIAKQIEQ